MVFLLRTFDTVSYLYTIQYVGIYSTITHPSLYSMSLRLQFSTEFSIDPLSENQRDWSTCG
jgi:hypothetical protein